MPKMRGKKATSNGQVNQASEEKNCSNSSEETVSENASAEKEENNGVADVPSVEEKAHEEGETTMKEGEAVIPPKEEEQSTKTDTNEPPAKKSKREKKEKGIRKPERSSTRVANQRIGKKMDDVKEEIVKKRASKTTRKTKETDQNGATTELVV